MSQSGLEQIKKLRKETKAGVMNCREALEKCSGDLKKAKEWLRQKGIASADKRADRETSCGMVETYQHPGGRIAAVVELACETDFVARTPDFKKLAHELAMQVAAMDPPDVKGFLSQPYIRDEKITVADLIKQAIGKLGENIVVKRFFRCQLGE